MAQQQHKQDWEDLGRLNPLWSILMYRKKWDIEDFFLTGEQEIQAVMECAKRLGYLKTNGLLVFQLPTYLPFYQRLMIHKKLYRLLRKAGISEQFLYRKLGLYPMSMICIPEKDIVAYLNAEGARVLEVVADNAVPP